MTDKERALIQKEIQGLTAKLRWTHIGEEIKDVYRERISVLEARLGEDSQ